jgi:hypothetical protein
LDVVAVDISGRHAVQGRYIMVCAAVAARISPEGVERAHGINLVHSISPSVELEVVIDLIQRAAQGFSGTVVAEKGDFYNLELWRAKSILGRELKYPESLGEKQAVELAHHISFSARNLLLEVGVT